MIEKCIDRKWSENCFSSRSKLKSMSLNDFTCRRRWSLWTSPDARLERGANMCISSFAELAPVGAACTEDMFRCNNGSCLNRTRVCDLTKDCADGEDEAADCGNCQIIPTTLSRPLVPLEFMTDYNRGTFQTKYQRTPDAISSTDGVAGGTCREDL